MYSVDEMETAPQLFEIPAALTLLIGDADEGTRVFRREGTQEEMAEWFDAICEHVGPTVSPGGALSGSKQRWDVIRRGTDSCW